MLLKAHSRNIINLYADGTQSRINEIRPATGASLTTQVYSLKCLYDADQVVSFLETKKKLSNSVQCNHLYVITSYSVYSCMYPDNFHSLFEVILHGNVA
jgi:hypothetical protein